MRILFNANITDDVFDKFFRHICKDKDKDKYKYKDKDKDKDDICSILGASVSCENWGFVCDIDKYYCKNISNPDNCRIYRYKK